METQSLNNIIIAILILISMSIAGCTAPLAYFAYKKGKKDGVTEQKELQEKDKADALKTE